PCSVTGLLASNSAANEWCARTGLTSTTARRTPSIRCIVISAPAGGSCTPKARHAQARSVPWQCGMWNRELEYRHGSSGRVGREPDRDREFQIPNSPFLIAPCGSPVRMPHQDLPASWHGGVSGVALVRTLPFVERQRAAKAGEAPGVETHERRVVAGGVR